MKETPYPVWRLGQDDDLIRHHLGTTHLPDFGELLRMPMDEGPAFRSAPPAELGRFPRPQHVPSASNSMTDARIVEPTRQRDVRFAEGRGRHPRVLPGGAPVHDRSQAGAGSVHQEIR